MRRIKIYIMLLFLLMVLPSSEAIADMTSYSSDGVYESIILDTAEILDPKEETALQKMIGKDILEQTNVAIVTIKKNRFGHSEDKSTYEYQYCDSIYTAFFANENETAECVIYLIDLENHWYYLYGQGNIKDVLKNSGVSFITDEVKARADSGEYYASTNSLLENVKKAMGFTEDPEVLDPVKNAETGYESVLLDYAGIMEEEEERQLLESMYKLTTYTNVCIATIDYNEFGRSDWDNSSELKYCSNLYDSRYGKTDGKYQNSVIFLIDMDSRWLYLYREGDIQEKLTEDICDTITDNCYTYASDGNYIRCSSKCMSQVLSVFEGEAIAEPMKLICNIFIALSFGFFITFIYASVSAKSMKPSDAAILQSIEHSFEMGEVTDRFIRTTKVYNPPSSSSGGSHHRSGGGGHSGGGSHGGGGGHRF